jgi:hypothetical protein
VQEHFERAHDSPKDGVQYVRNKETQIYCSFPPEVWEPSTNNQIQSSRNSELCCFAFLATYFFMKAIPGFHPSGHACMFKIAPGNFTCEDV